MTFAVALAHMIAIIIIFCCPVSDLFFSPPPLQSAESLPTLCNAFLFNLSTVQWEKGNRSRIGKIAYRNCLVSSPTLRPHRADTLLKKGWE